MVIDSAGNPIASASVTVKHVGTAVNAPLFSDEGITSLANPVTTDSLGRFAFYAADGDYDLEIVKSGVINVTVTDVSIVDPKRILELTLNDDAHFLMNAFFDRQAAQWKRRDTAKIAYRLFLDRVSDALIVSRAPSGANPITWTEQLRFGTTRHTYKQSMAQVSKSAAQTLTTAIEAAVTFDTEQFDTDTLHDNVTNNSRLTSAIAGKYLVFATIHFGGSATGRRVITFRKNGLDTEGLRTEIAATTADELILPLTGIISVAATDYVEVWAFQTSGGNLNVNTAYTRFGMVYVGE